MISFGEFTTDWFEYKLRFSLRIRGSFNSWLVIAASVRHKAERYMEIRCILLMVLEKIVRKVYDILKAHIQKQYDILNNFVHGTAITITKISNFKLSGQ